MSTVLFVRDESALGRVDPSARVVPASEHRQLLEAQAMIDVARAQAEAIVDGAQAAFEAERARGHAEGLAAARAESAEQMIENVGRTIDYFEAVEERMIALVVQAMRRLIADYDDRERVVVVVRSALAAVRNLKQVTLRVPIDRLEMVQASVNEILASYPGIGYLDLQGDARLQGDACIVETEIGIVEASIDGQVVALQGAFEKILGSRK
jgi:type III secretion protein L